MWIPNGLPGTVSKVSYPGFLPSFIMPPYNPEASKSMISGFDFVERQYPNSHAFRCYIEVIDYYIFKLQSNFWAGSQRAWPKGPESKEPGQRGLSQRGLDPKGPDLKGSDPKGPHQT